LFLTLGIYTNEGIKNKKFNSNSMTSHNVKNIIVNVNLVVAFLQEVDVTVEYFDKQLDLHSLVHALSGNTHSFFETICCVLTILQLATHTNYKI